MFRKSWGHTTRVILEYEFSLECARNSSIKQQQQQQQYDLSKIYTSLLHVVHVSNFAIGNAFICVWGGQPPIRLHSNIRLHYTNSHIHTHTTTNTNFSFYRHRRRNTTYYMKLSAFLSFIHFYISTIILFIYL